MGQDSKIEWTDHTINLWWGCEHVHEGCDNCYAEIFSNRFNEKLWGGAGTKRKLMPNAFKELDKLQARAKKNNTIERVFVGSMFDIFEKSMPLTNLDPNNDHLRMTDDLRQEFFTRITWGDNGMYPNLILLLLTKRPSNIAKMVPAGWLDEPPKNIMYGTSVSTQKNLDTLVPQLFKVPGKHFISMEPQLEEVTLLKFSDAEGEQIHWLIQGGESGRKKRPFDIGWARRTRDECYSWSIPYFFKQIDKVQPIPEDLMIRQFP